jgi:hypothetical protein
MEVCGGFLQCLIPNGRSDDVWQIKAAMVEPQPTDALKRVPTTLYGPLKRVQDAAAVLLKRCGMKKSKIIIGPLHSGNRVPSGYRARWDGGGATLQQSSAHPLNMKELTR